MVCSYFCFWPLRRGLGSEYLVGFSLCIVARAIRLRLPLSFSASRVSVSSTGPRRNRPLAIGLTTCGRAATHVSPCRVRCLPRRQSTLRIGPTFFIVKISERPDCALIKRLLRYFFWLGKANVIVNFSLYQGTFLLMLLKQPAATGLLGLGLTSSLAFFAL